MKIYVNLAFLENLFLAEEQTDRHFYMKRLLNSQQPGVEVITDVDIEEAYKDPEKRPILRQIAQRLPLTEVNFVADCQIESFHHSGEPKLVFADGVSLAIDQQFGCFHASTVTLEKADFLFHAEELRMDGSQRDWSILKQIKHPCNALVLTDNYLFSNDERYENIQSICDCLMPDSLTAGFTFDLTLIGYDSKKDFKPLKVQYEALRKYLQKFSYPVNLTIIRDSYHDRYIFTNYYRIASGAGFALFENRKIPGSKQTTLNCKSVIYEGKLSSMHQNRKEELAKCMSINRENGEASGRLLGNKINRLLS